MKYVSLSEASKLVGKSLSTIKRFVKANEDKDIFKREKLPTGHSKIYIQRSALLSHFNRSSEPLVNTSNEPLVNYSNEPLNEPLKRSDLSNDLEKDYISTLKEQLNAKEKELEQKNNEINHFLELEDKLIDRFKEINENLRIAQHQLQQQTELAESRQQKLLSFYAKEEQQKTYSFEVEAEEVEQIIEEEPNTTEHTPEDEAPQEPKTFSDYLKQFK